MELTQYDWMFCLQMLSIEHTEPFGAELGLSISADGFHQTMLSARACLELQIAFEFERGGVAGRGATLPSRWLDYRQSAPALADPLLSDLLPLATQPGNDERVFAKLHGENGHDRLTGLRQWFKANFRARPDPVWLWPWALRLFFVEGRDNIVADYRGLPELKKLLIANWSRCYEQMKEEIGRRFYSLTRYALDHPSKWEKVLLAYNSEGDRERNDNLWLLYIEQCLSFRLIVRECKNLESLLGRESLWDVVGFVFQNAHHLPSDQTLPDPPFWAPRW